MSATAAEFHALLGELRPGKHGFPEGPGRSHPIALATLVDVRGSSYRRPGARLLVREDGSTVGNLTGGCLDAEIIEAAGEVERTGDARRLSFDLSADDEAVLGWGMGCNGVLDILVEPAASARVSAGVITEAMSARRPAALLTIVSGSAVGQHWWQTGSAGPARGPEGAGPPPDAVRSALVAGRTGLVTLPSSRGRGEEQAFVEVLQPPPRLVVCGAGVDALPVTRRAAELGWDVCVVDDRRPALSPDRFPPGTTLILSSAGPSRELPVDGNTHVVVMSHNFLRDRDYLGAAMATDARYIGVLGPRRRLQRLLDDLGRDGVALTGRDGRRLHGPAGLDLGAQGPDEIAISIIAEVLAASRGRDGQEPAGRPYALDLAAEPPV
ncbi:XdhC/CoxI family protein [Streptomyces sp. NPDC046862]|uniref:XdhC family protein n=1 Tax=Streptomyces sp. NPDC046862 TaxID=3154603 RepID=UPI0034556F48